MLYKVFQVESHYAFIGETANALPSLRPAPLGTIDLSVPNIHSIEARPLFQEFPAVR